MKNNIKYLPVLLGATLALGFALGGLLIIHLANYFSANNTSKQNSVNLLTLSIMNMWMM
jgi:carboxyl-terminal processing protease